MGIYLANYLSLPIYKAVIKNKKTFCIVISLQLFLILALRNTAMVDVDIPVYDKAFQIIRDISFPNLLSETGFFILRGFVGFEGGYVLFNWLISHIGIGFHGFLVICGAINCVSVGRFIYKYSDNPLLSFSIFIAFDMYTYCFFILRQSLALSIILWAVPFMLERKRLKAMLIILLASSFHLTASIIIPLLFVFDKPITRNKFIFVSLIGIFLTFVSPFIYNNIISKILIYFKVGHTDVHFQLNNYVILISIFAILIFTFIDFRIFDDKSLNLVCWGFLLLFLVEPFAMCNEVFARSTELYTIFIVILIPEIIRRYKDFKTSKLANCMAYVLMFGYLVYRLSSGSYIVPYESIF